MLYFGRQHPLRLDLHFRLSFQSWDRNRDPSILFVHLKQSLQSFFESSVAQMVFPVCFLNIPALATTVISSGYHIPATLAYAPTNTNYFGGTSCGLSSCQSRSFHRL